VSQTIDLTDVKSGFSDKPASTGNRTLRGITARRHRIRIGHITDVTPTIGPVTRRHQRATV
jgi:hypothetical protein